MKRDMELVKKILLFIVEKLDDPTHVDRNGHKMEYVTAAAIESHFNSYGYPFVHMHLVILKIEGAFVLDERETNYIKIKYLSWKGNDILDRLCDQSDSSLP